MITDCTAQNSCGSNGRDREVLRWLDERQSPLKLVLNPSRQLEQLSHYASNEYSLFFFLHVGKSA